MSALTSFENIFERYDLVNEVSADGSSVKGKDNALQEVMQRVIDGEDVADVVKEALKDHDPMEIISEGLVKGMEEVSRLWDEGVYYLPQALISSDVMLEGIDICEEKMGAAMEKKGVVITHTAEGDIHDLGQKIANALLRANGYEVIDLGKDVPVDEVVAAVKKYKPLMVTGTALMTTTMTAFEKIAKKLTLGNLQLPFVCGGGAVSLEYVTGFDLGVWGKDASQAPQMAADSALGKSWQTIREKYNA